MDAFWACDGCHSLNRQRDDRCYHCRAPRTSSAQAIADQRADPSQSSGGWRSAAAYGAGAATGSGLASLNTSALAAVAAPNTLAGGVTIATDPAARFSPGGGSLAGSPADLLGPGRGTLPATGRDSGTSLLGALILGSGAALAATALWFGVVSATHIQAGFVAIAVGWLVAQAVVWGGGGRGSVALIPISVTLTFLALAASEYLIVVKAVGDALTEAGYSYTLDVIQPPDIVLEAIKLSIQLDPLTLVFWTIAIVEAFLVPLRQLARPS